MAAYPPGSVPDTDEIIRGALERIRELRGMGYTAEGDTLEPLPTAYPELWPGGPGVDTGDIRLAEGGGMGKNWIAGAIKHPGALHRDLGVKQGQKIPVSRIMAAARGKGKTARRARLALTLRKMHRSRSA